MGVVVTGIGLISALGDRTRTWEGLLLGKSGIRLHQPFPELPPRPLGQISTQPTTNLIALTQNVVTAALADADLSPPLPDCGIVIGSSRNQQGRLEQVSRGYYANANSLNSRSEGLNDSLADWITLFPSATSQAVAQQIGATGPVLSPMAACATGIWAIAQGYELIQTGQCQRAIVGAIETPITPLTLASFQQAGVLAQTGAYPFDQQREGFGLGEGGAVLILESSELASQRAVQIYGKILGFGLTTDGYHITAPDPKHRGALLAVKHCLQRSQLIPDQIDYIHPHGTGTQLNDLMEADLIRTLFSMPIPVSGSKGATGHTLGASGALGTAICLQALKQQTLPPCIGLRTPAFALNFLTTAEHAPIQTALCCSFGFGGQNAAIALGRNLA